MSDYYGIEPKFVGKNNAANGVSTSAVVANADGTVLERLEYVQTALGGSAGQLRFQQSASNVVEDDSYAQFEITLMDINSGAITSANINIAAITVDLSKSTGGAAFSNVGITQPTFSKADGRVYCSYKFLAAEWAVGDTYKLSVSNIIVTFGAEYAYVPMMVWCNIVTDIIDIDAVVDDIKTYTGKISDVAVTVGMTAGSLSSYIAGNNGGLGTQLPASSSLYDTTKNIRSVPIDGTTLPVANTLSDTLHKDGNFTYDNTTDSLEAISDRISNGVYAVTAGAGSSASAVVDATFTQAEGYWKGALLVCITGDNLGQARPVTSFTAATDSFNVTPAFSADTTGDTFLLVSGYGLTGWLPQTDVAVTYNTDDSEDTVLSLNTAGTSYALKNLYLKFADPGANTITVRLKLLINDVSTTVKTFAVTTANYATYFSLFDMFGEQQVIGDSIIITTQNSAAANVAVTGQYQYDLSYTG